MTKNKDSTRYYSSNQESYIAKILNGRVRANNELMKIVFVKH